MSDKLKEYQKGFNHGYYMSKYLPELAKSIVQSPNPESEYFNGLIFGKQEHEMERMRNRLKISSPVKENPSKSKENDIEKEL